MMYHWLEIFQAIIFLKAGGAAAKAEATYLWGRRFQPTGRGLTGSCRIPAAAAP